MQQDLLWAFVLIFAMDSIAPGPAVAMVMSRGATVGLWRTLPFIAGLVVGDLILFSLALLGLVAMVSALGPLFFLLKWLGVGYLLLLAYRMWTATAYVHAHAVIPAPAHQDFLLALILPLGNPKAIGFYVALLPAFMDVGQLTSDTALNFSLAIVFIWSSVLVLYTWLADQGRQRIAHSGAQDWLNKGSATAMLGAAITLAWQRDAP